MRRGTTRTARVNALACCVVLALACSTTNETERQHLRERVARAEQDLTNDRAVQAELAAVRAAQSREDSGQLVDEVEVRVGDAYIDDDHRVRVTARLPLNRPAAVRAERDVLRAETEIAVSRLEQVSLERRAEMCFPAMEALAWGQRRDLYATYAERQYILLDWNREWRNSGTINELSGARFELERRVRLASWEPRPIAPPDAGAFQLPEVSSDRGGLITSPEYVRKTVRIHHPTIAVMQATSERYRALAAGARARSQPWIKFVDVSYLHRSDENDNGVGGQVAFEIPLGGSRHANIGRYESLVHRERSQSESALDEQMLASLRALSEIDEFESLAPRWVELQQLAIQAEEIGERWWRQRLAKPAAVAQVFDEALSARLTVLEARERAGNAYCTILAMTGVDPKDWPRVEPQASDEPRD